ncbi:hypothetical protein CsSME_00014232 [Camellia sinensis var. sinensis]
MRVCWIMRKMKHILQGFYMPHVLVNDAPHDVDLQEHRLIIDGSWRKDNRSAGIACVCYDANEEPIAQRAAQLNLPSAFAAEVTACQRAIQWAKEQRLLNIHIWPDSQILVYVLCK